VRHLPEPGEEPAARPGVVSEHLPELRHETHAPSLPSVDLDMHYAGHGFHDTREGLRPKALPCGAGWAPRLVPVVPVVPVPRSRRVSGAATLAAPSMKRPLLPVGIIGAGPAGATLARLLAEGGIPAVLID